MSIYQKDYEWNRGKNTETDGASNRTRPLWVVGGLGGLLALVLLGSLTMSTVAPPVDKTNAGAANAEAVQAPQTKLEQQVIDLQGEVTRLKAAPFPAATPSTETRGSMLIEVTNDSPSFVTIQVLGPDGTELLSQQLDAGKTASYTVPKGSRWRVRAANGRLLRDFLATQDLTTVISP